ncbi:MAG TPA: LPS export ABC transporter periplasmic protein LptC [Ferruginibacter sp.]|nr:LPS export ABC transporter periplasmic protein LptC [Chitinophagaceae bacterium]HRI23282.1 LPS export ABC transporter periplasmic protein LptC [Ferruginibacter sp.]
MFISRGRSFRFANNRHLAICIAFVSSTGILFSCENTDKELHDMNSKNLGVEEVKNADINYTLGGKAKAKLLSPLMLRVQDAKPYVEFPKTLHVDFYDETGAIDSRLDALYGKYYETESKVFLKDSVRVINIKGDTLYCNELWWDRNRTGLEFYTDKTVRIRRKLEIIDGVGMEARQDFKEWVIRNVTNSFIRVRNSEFPTD